MEAFKVDLTDYVITLPDDKEVPYHVKDSLCMLLMNPELKLNGTGLLQRNVIGEKILAAGDEILLSNEEMGFLKQGADAAKGLSKNDVQLVKRILEAEAVKVAEQVE